MKSQEMKVEEETHHKQIADVKTWKNAVKCPHLVSLILIGFVVIIILRPDQNNGNTIIETLDFHKSEQIDSKNGPVPECNLFSGKWVYDNVSYPLYEEAQCPLMEDKFTACEKYGRKEFKYRNWRWQPHNCDIPRFDGRALLEKMRGKKVIFVGDSLCRNQWESMLCLIEPYLPPSSDKSRKEQVKLEGNLYKFYSVEYDMTMGFYWAPFLVESNCDDPKNHLNKWTHILRINSIEKHGRQWIDADILIFDSYTWWMDSTITMLWGSFDSPDAIYKPVNMYHRLYEMALETWSDWLEMHINGSRTKMFFMSHSPTHAANDVGEEYKCLNQTEPIFNETYWPTSVSPMLIKITESMIEKLEERGVKVQYLNVTQLSGYRKDAHPSIFRNSASPGLYSDCIHWCLPGVPDVWNQILYAYIMKS